MTGRMDEANDQPVPPDMPAPQAVQVATALEETQSPVEPTNIEKLRGMPWSLAFDVANTFFVQFTFFGTAFILFLNDLGLSKTEIGFLLSLFPFFGLLSLVIGPRVARHGFKRTFLSSFGARTLATAALLLTPLVLAQFGSGRVLLYVTLVTFSFAISRSVAMTALLPWQQEYIPERMRGKFAAYSSIFVSLAGLVAVSTVSYVLGDSPALSQYMMIIGLGVVFGFISIFFAGRIPGGAAVHAATSLASVTRGLVEPLRDSNFLRYILGIGLIALTSGSVFSFLPLYMQETVGLSSGNVVLLQTGSLIGSMVTSYVWGWAADRYGSRPVMLTGLLLNASLPLWWLIMPRQSGASLYIALGIALLQGIAGAGWGIGSGRQLFVSVVPPENKSPYLALYNAWTGVVGGTSQIVGGRLLDAFSGLQTQVAGFMVDEYSILFTAGVIFPLISLLILRSVRSETRMTVYEFAGLFFNGNPFLAIDSLFRFYLAKDEPATVSVAERLGKAASPLTVEELLEILEDPRFYVRFEAIVSIARRKADPRLLDALIRILEGYDPALSVISAWALGRIGDPRAIEPLRACLHAPYRSIKAHAARSLGSLQDTDSIPALLDLLNLETESGLSIAYASALGKLGATQAVPRILALLKDESLSEHRQELALALARLVGSEGHYIQFLRSAHKDLDTALAQHLLQFKRHLGSVSPEAVLDRLDAAADAFARGDWPAGDDFLSNTILALPADLFCGYCWEILQSCAKEMKTHHPAQVEYRILAVHTLDEGWRQQAGSASG